MTKPKTPVAPVPPPPAIDGLPAFTPVPRITMRHDGWSPERQRAFIAALADTGVVSSAARYVNMSKWTAYALRRHPGAESFRRAWDAALDMGVQRLKDELYERAIEGQLKPVFVGGKLKGFQRVKNDRLLMFALRMSARDERGERVFASNVMARDDTGRFIGALTAPAPTRAEKDDMNAALVEHFDPVAMTLPEIEAMQAMLVDAAKRKRAEEEGPADQDPSVAFLANKDDGAFKPVGPLEDIVPVGSEEELAEFDEDEERWWELGDGD